ncbi:MAG: protein adenylyltransferase SelO [Immundisolibacter sp.]|uniref:protein adenylyltransferase SelO n=1 Tax=Immundisolibacter sp. TaxID=1934948 RepID=UPI003EE363A4
MLQIGDLVFDNRFARLPSAFFARQAPTALPEPYLIALNPDVAAVLGVDPAEAHRPRFAEYLAGNRLLPGAEPLAAVYAGHQFGVFVPQLGDGRAILLGEVLAADGERYEIQLKGAGPTPFSRNADGRAVLRSTIREYLAGEAMHGLGIATTRALAIVGSDQRIYREQIETAAVLTRIAPNHVRFGSFEFFHYRGQTERVAQLADFVIETQFPDWVELPDRHLRLLDMAVERTARMIAAWQAQGFVHGVMNTDNMSILGLTLDYGPYGFLDHFEAARVFNHTDRGGRYAYAMQAQVGLWNLHALAEALSSLLPQEQRETSLAKFEPLFLAAYGDLMRRKLGLRDTDLADADLVDRLLHAMQDGRVDYSCLLRGLGGFRAHDPATRAPLQALSQTPQAIDAWLDEYALRLASQGEDDAQRQTRMDAANPLYVLRTHLAERAIRQAADQRDYSEIERLRRLLAAPFTPQPGAEDYAAPPPATDVAVELSCSS